MDTLDAAAEDKTASDDKLRDVHLRALRRFSEAVRPQLEVRTISLAARRIAAIPGALWDGEFGERFESAVKLDIHKLGKTLRKARNDYRQNRIVPDFRPAGGVADKDTADTLDGLHRADSYDYKAQEGRDNAFDEATAGGFGAYRLTNEWSDPLNADADEQRINPGLVIVDADQSVFFGPSTRYDKSDARYAFVLTQIAPEDFADEWGDDKVVSWPEELPRCDWFSWFRPDAIVQAEYYEVEEVRERLLIYTHALIPDEEQRHWEKEITSQDRSDLEAMGWTATRRTVKRRRCHKYVLSGAEVLDGPKRIAGGSIPIVPVYGNRAYVDGVEWFVGVLPTSKIDAARLYAAMVSNLAEIQAFAPYEKPIFAPEQITPNLQPLWERGNIDRHAYALANPVLDPVTGGIAAMGPVGKVEPPSLPQALAALLEIANRDATEDDGDGAEQVKANTSEEAMNVAAARVDAKSGINLDNMRQSVQREGELYLGMARDVYVEQGRVVATMTEDGDDGEATLYEEHSGDDGVLKVRNDFANGSYKVIASVTEATATRRDRTVKQMLTVADVSIKANDLPGAQAALITASANMDGEGMDEFQRWNRKRGLELGLFEPNDDEKREMAEAAEQAGQEPDPNAVLAAAQAEALEAGAERDRAQAAKTTVDARVSEAKVLETLASAADKRVEAGLRPVEVANDTAPPPPEQRIRFGYEGAQ